MPFPQTPSPLNMVLMAKTYNAAWFSGSTNEIKITNAIAAAAVDGAKYVLVPENMIPYIATNVTYNSTVRLIREGHLTDIVDVVAYGADPTGTNDSTVAIQRADEAAVSGLIVIGSEVQAQTRVYFPQGTFKTTSLIQYGGAPWQGAGQDVTTIKYYGTSACIQAGGTNASRRIVRINDMTFSGFTALTGAYGIRFGYNMRSSGALNRVRVQGFPLWGLYFAEPNWIMSFNDVSLNNNLLGAIGFDVSNTDLNDIVFNNLVAENNGTTGSGAAGVCDFTAACKNIVFNGGSWESNKGDAEARFTDGQVVLNGVGIECDVPPADATDGLVFAGACQASIFGGKIVPSAARSGYALRAQGTSRVIYDRVLFGGGWSAGQSIKVENTAVVTECSVGGGNNTDLATVATGAAFNRLSRIASTLTDAATITVNAALGNVFTVTLGGNRTMGAPTNPSLNQVITFIIIQDGTGGRTLNFTPAVFKHAWSDTGNTAGKRSSISYIFDGTNWNQLGAQSPYI